MLFWSLLIVRFMTMSGDLMKFSFIDEVALIVLHVTTEKEVGGITTVLLLLSMRHGVCLKETRETLFGLVGKVGMKL